jgi:hypothetical protein
MRCTPCLALLATLFACQPETTTWTPLEESALDADWGIEEHDPFAPPVLTLWGEHAWVGAPTVLQFKGTELAEGERAHLLATMSGEGAGLCYRIIGFECVDLLPPVRAISAETMDVAGEATFTVSLPPSAEPGGTVSFQVVVVRGVDGRDSVLSNGITLETRPWIEGCTDPGALDFDPLATIDDGSCSYAIGSEALPGLSCWDVLARRAGAADGVYWVDGDSDGPIAPYEAYCDMTTDGGGWTLVDNDAADGDVFASREEGATTDPGLTRGAYLPSYRWSDAPQLLCQSSFYTGDQPWVSFDALTGTAQEYPLHTTMGGSHDGHWGIAELNGNVDNGSKSWIYSDGAERFGSVWIGNGDDPTCACNYAGLKQTGLGAKTPGDTATCSTWVR